MAIPTDHSDIPLAIIGMGCRLPGAEDLEQYWQLVSQGRSAIAEVPAHRLDQELYYNPEKGVRGKTYSKLAALLSNRGIDLERYPIAEELRRSVDPMHLIMTAVAADAVRHAGLDPFNLPIKNSAVFIGHAVGSSELRNLTYASLLDEALAILDNVDGFKELSVAERQKMVAECRTQILDELGVTPVDGRNLYCNMVAGTVAKAFGLTGPWLALNSACASSLHAMLMGARALQQGRVDMVIAGGASDCNAHTLVLFSHAQAMSSTSSRPFDANADGLIMSEGYVAVVMKTLERALADGDPIQAVVRGLGVATDGRGKSLWAPRKEGQVKAMQRAYRSGVDMAGLQYLECHATATQLGDATELETLGEVLGPKMPPGKRIAITSVKANIGHSLEAAGVAGLIKTILCMQHQTIPPAINLETLNPKVDWKSAPYYIPQAASPWTAGANGEPRRAAVNAFGIGGLNMHVVIDEFSEAYHRKLLASRRPQPQALTTASNGSPASSNGAADHSDDKSIAIIGMGCIFPGAEGLTQFWDKLSTGQDPKTSPAAPRWSPLALSATDGKQLVGGFVTDFQYNWRKHKVPPKQVAEADPLQFMFLEAAEQALADAGYDRKPLDRERCGVMVGTEFGGDFCDELEMGLRLPEMKHVFTQLLSRRGVSAEKIEQINTQFADILVRKWPSLVDETGSFTTSTLASRISKTLDLAGGAVAIDSGSTSAMSGLSICVDMLLSGDNDMIICAAGQRRMGLNGFRALENAGLLASAGPHSVLDAKYDGVVPAEGVGVVILKRLADARRDGDRIHAVLRGIGVAHHASHAEALRLAVERSSAMAGIAPNEVSVEELETDEQLSATGAELQTLASMHASGERKAPLAMGSGTAQFGHLGGASGMVALIKASLEIEHGETAPSAGLNQPAAVLGPWQHAVQATSGSTKLTGRRLVGISCWSRGLACHLILEHGVATSVQPAASQPAQMAAPAPVRTQTTPRPQVAANGNGHRLPTPSRMPAHVGAPAQLVGAGAAPARAQQADAGRPSRPSASARPPATPRAASEWQICRLAGGTTAELLADIDQALAEPTAAWRASAARGFVAADKLRLAVVADSAESLSDKLRLARPQLDNLAARNVLEQQGIFYRATPSVRPQVAFVFPGQGSQYSGMLRPLVENVPAAARALAEIDSVMVALGHPKFADLAWSAGDRLGQDVWTTQVSMLLADSLLLAALADRGIRPDLVLGHSYGEFVALYAAGAWDFSTAVRMTQARCAGIDAAVAGGETGMLATDATPELIEQLSSTLVLDLYVANLNAPDQCVVGGTRKDLTELAAALSSQSRQARMLAVPGAFHTPLLSAASRPLEEALRGATIVSPEVKFVSTVNNSVIGDPAEIRRNLARQLTTPVRYAQLIGRLAAESPTVFVEVGPQQTLTRLNRRILGSAADVIASDNPKRTAWEPLLGVQALLECLGACPASAPKKALAGLQSAAAQTAAPQIAAAKSTPSVKPQPSTATAPVTATKGTTPLSDQRSTSHEIPHFDATERRREKMRSANGPVGARGTNGPAAKPAASPTAAVAKPAPVAAKPAPPVAKPSPVAVKPAPMAAKPATMPTGNNGSTNGSTGHHSAAHSAPAPVAAAAPQPASAPQHAAPKNVVVESAPAQAGAPGNSAAELEAFLINFVVEQTGYPAEVVDLDADLEADLGIDSIKKAQLFGELQEYFDISALGTGAAEGGSLSLDDFTTLRHVLNFLVKSTPAASGNASTNGHHPTGVVAQPVAAAVAVHSEPAAPVAVAVASASVETAPAQAGAPGNSAAELEAFLINFVVEQTGYPAEVVDLDADLEADLGIDSIKKAQLFGELQEYFDISALGSGSTEGGSLSLDDFTTLRHVLNFLVKSTPAASSHVAASSPAPVEVAQQPVAAPVAEPPPQPVAAEIASPTSAGPGTGAAELEAFLINFVVEQTGYPAEVVDLDADLEADLGIDSIKKAQLFGELQEYFDISALGAGGAGGGTLSLDDFTTLRHVLNFLIQAQPGAASTASIEQVFATTEPAPAVATLITQPAPAAASHDSSEVANEGSTESESATTGETAERASELEAFLINFVVEQTGYPAEVVDLDADLEADLGIDSIKKAQLFGELQEYFDIGALGAGSEGGGNLSLDDFATLRQVLDFLMGASPASPASATPSGIDEPVAVEECATPAGDLHIAETADVEASGSGESDSPAAVELSGTPYEIGWQHGRQFKAEIQRILRHYADCVGDQLDELPGQTSRIAPERVLSADELDELQGLADAVEVPLGNLLAHHLALMSESGAAAGQMASQIRSAGAPHWIHGLRQPAPLVGALRAVAQPVIFARCLNGEIAHLGVSYLGCVGILGGLNAAGLAITAYPIDREASPAIALEVRDGFRSVGGVAASTLVRTVLGSATNLEQAVKLARSLAVAGGQAWVALVTCAAADEAITIEFDGSDLRVQSAPQKITIGELGSAAETSDVGAGQLPTLWASGSLLGPDSAAMPRTFAPADGSECLALVVEPVAGKLWLNGSTTADTTSLPAWNGAAPVAAVVQAGNESPPAALPAEPITARFSLEMREAPLSADAPAEPAWTGQAIVLGTGPTAEALQSRLEKSGVVVHMLVPGSDADAVLSELEAICGNGPAPHLFLTTARDCLPIDPYHIELWDEEHYTTMMLPFLVCQKWTQLAVAGGWLDRATLVATTAQGGDFGFDRGAEASQGGSLAGLLKAIFVEYAIMQNMKNLRVKVVDASSDVAAETLAGQVLSELGSGNLAYEVAYVGSRRLVPYAVERNLGPTSDTQTGVSKPATRPGSAVRHGSTWVATGGARGITAAAAMELGCRFGLKLHLIGTTPLVEVDPAWRELTGEGLQKLKASVMIAARKAGKPTAQAWQRVEKDLEIDRTLRGFAAAGVSVTYHACDVSDRAAMAETLDRIRQVDGPISGVLHGAGIERSCRFERKQRDVVLQTIRAKVDGTAHLMALTQRDPIRHFIVFGSISGRLGGYGQTDYSLANEMACKLLGSYRRARPWVQAVGIHWHPWDDVGMAARPETKSILQEKGALALMPMAEGLAHLVREMAAGTPEPEVMITERHHWERFAAGLGTLAAEVRGSAPAETASVATVETIETTTEAVAIETVEATAGEVENCEAATEPVEAAAIELETTESETAETNTVAPFVFETERCRLRALEAPLPSGSPAMPAFDTPVWILGSNADADAFASRLFEAKVAVRRLPMGSGADPAADFEALLAAVDTLWAQQPSKYLVVMTGRDPLAGSLCEPALMNSRRERGMMQPFFVVQRWYKLLSKQPELGVGTLAAVVSLGGDFGFTRPAVSPEGGALAGLLKSLKIEDARRDVPCVRTKVIDLPAAVPSQELATALLAELAADEPEVEICWNNGTRRVIRPLAAPLSAGEVVREIRPGGNWVVTGGARGISAIAARELARRYGWKLHLLGKSPAPQTDAPWRNYSPAELASYKTAVTRGAVAEGRSPSQAWDRVMKDVEIAANLTSFADAGVQATYHSCDVTDRDALAKVLEAVRGQDGPIDGILHGAGLIDNSRLENKRPQVVAGILATKFDGTLNLMALTERDPLAWFIGFGSISGRFGGNGLADYSASNDVLAKLVDWFRGQRPECAATCIHWESWEGSGMATQPSISWGARSMNMRYMQPEEGVGRLQQELAAGLPESELLFTFGDYYRTFYPREQAEVALPMVACVVGDANGAVGQVALDPAADRFLLEHRLRFKPLLPVVVGLESLAEAACVASGRPTIGFRDIDMVDGLIFHSDRPITAQASATRLADGTYACRLTSDFYNRNGGLIQPDRLYLTATAVPADVHVEPLTPIAPTTGPWRDFSYPNEAPIYHGPVFRGMNAACYVADRGTARILALPMKDLVGSARVTGWTIPSCVLDAAMYACAMHLWAFGGNAIALPRRIADLRLGRMPRDGETCLVHFVCVDFATGVYDFDIVGEDGSIIARARGYGQVIFARGVSA